MFYIGVLFIFGVNVKVKGNPIKNKAIFFSNHTSYLDIFILGSIVNGLFVAKSEIKSWPIISFICKLGKTIFVNRGRRSETTFQLNQIINNLKSGYNIFIFPEGTSNDGTKILPFKSSLFEIIKIGKEEKFRIQPVSISYLYLDGMPINKSLRKLISWYGRMDLLPHVWKFIGLGKSEIQVYFHEPKYFKEFSNRKDACGYCFEQISRQFEESVNQVETKEKLSNFYGFKSL